jgi:hypothetical protein
MSNYLRQSLTHPWVTYEIPRQAPPDKAIRTRRRQRHSRTASLPLPRVTCENQTRSRDAVGRTPGPSRPRPPPHVWCDIVRVCVRPELECCGFSNSQRAHARAHAHARSDAPARNPPRAVADKQAWLSTITSSTSIAVRWSCWRRATRSSISCRRGERTCETRWTERRAPSLQTLLRAPGSSARRRKRVSTEWRDAQPSSRLPGWRSLHAVTKLPSLC